jgi:hypothetical protein
MKIIQTNKDNVLVDDDMYPFLNLFKWQISINECGHRAAYTNAIIGNKHCTVYMHQLLNGLRKSKIIFKDGNKLNCQRENLVLSKSANKTGYKGVVKKKNRYEAVFYYEGIRVYLGRFNTAQEAGMAYTKKKNELVYKQIQEGKQQLRIENKGD